jgi:hypothetical protein
MQIGDQYLVEVRGWIMCAKVESGRYRIEIGKHRSGSLVATFYRPRGKKPLVRHFVDDIMLSDGENLNGTVILKKLAIGGNEIGY